jgi:hypothetical protein
MIVLSNTDLNEKISIFMSKQYNTTNSLIEYPLEDFEFERYLIRNSDRGSQIHSYVDMVINVSNDVMIPT